jgi:hypothetical protein
MSLDERKWLFTSDSSDLRGNLAGKAFFDGQGSQTADFMGVKFYEKRSPDQRDKDINEQFVSFIVDAATFARDIDPSVGAAFMPATDPAIVNEARENVTKYLLQNNPMPANIDPEIRNAINSVKIQYGTAANQQAIVDDTENTIAAILAKKKRSGAPFVTLSNPQAKALYDNVFAKWDQYTKETQDFYDRFVQLQKKGGAGWSQAPESEYATAGSSPDNYRLNLKKNQNKVDIGQSLPAYDSANQENVWYRATGSRLLSTKPNNANVFRDLYQAVYIGDMVGNAAANALFPNINLTPSGDKIFNIKVDDLVRKRMFVVDKAEISTETKVLEGEKQYAMLDMVDRQIISRNADGNLLVKIDGKTYEYGANDDETRKVFKASHKCYGTYVNDDGETCKKFMFEALLSQDKKAIENFLKDLKMQDFYKTATSDIKNMHPVIALRILQQFGFHKYQSYDSEAGGQLYKVEDVNHWLNTYMKKKFTDVQVQQMIDQNDTYQILSYLDLVSQFVNANPAILNKNYSGSSEEAAGKFKRSEYAEKLKLDWHRPIPARAAVGVDFGRLRGYLQVDRTMRQPFFNQMGNQFVTPFGTPGFSPNMGMVQMIGGTYTIPSFNAPGQVTGAKFLRHYLDAILVDLRAKNKTLSSTEEQRLKDHIQKLTKLEDEMIKTLAFLDEYNRLLNTFKDYEATTINEPVNQYVQKFMDRYRTLDGKYQATEDLIMQVIAKVQGLVGSDNRNYTGPLQLPQ